MYVVLTPSELTLQPILKFCLWNKGSFIQLLNFVIPLPAQTSVISVEIEVKVLLMKRSSTFFGNINTTLQHKRCLVAATAKKSTNKVPAIVELRCIFLALWQIYSINICMFIM